MFEGLKIPTRCLCRVVPTFVNLGNRDNNPNWRWEVSVHVLHEFEALRVGAQTHRTPLPREHRNLPFRAVVCVKPSRPKVKQLLFVKIILQLISLTVRCSRDLKLYPMRLRLARWGSPTFAKQLYPVLWLASEPRCSIFSHLVRHKASNCRSRSASAEASNSITRPAPKRAAGPWIFPSIRPLNGSSSKSPSAGTPPGDEFENGEKLQWGPCRSSNGPVRGLGARDSGSRAHPPALSRAVPVDYPRIMPPGRPEIPNAGKSIPGAILAFLRKIHGPARPLRPARQALGHP